MALRVVLGVRTDIPLLPVRSDGLHTDPEKRMLPYQAKTILQSHPILVKPVDDDEFAGGRLHVEQGGTDGESVPVPI